MPNNNRQQVRNLFMELADLPAADRPAALTRICGDDASLRAEVESLLRADQQASGFMDTPTADFGYGSHAAPTLGAPLHERAGTKIGPYKLLQLIGEGGFGSVFMAEQSAPVQRKVALKIIKLGMDTRQVVARFEQERQALAMMDHANIARVLDAGATETGRPFFVMELVKGDPIVEYCDKNNLSINDRLELFAQVCNAVQHAHTKGIIHRDIKPSNILVSTQDGKPNTKVIDFGIAKATVAKLTEKTLFTEHRQLIGTPEYMSPEQAAGSLDIDTRTDVYSLGVLLYELLTGTTPFSSNELRSAAYAEIQRIIREVDPPKPSTRLSSNTNTIANVAARRNTEPKRLGTLIRGELDWIVMRSLEKDRQRRYETPSSLSADIKRYLSGEAVVAAPPSTMYSLKKFVLRNKGTVMAGAVVALSLLLGLAGTAWQATRAGRQRDLAISARESETLQRQAAETERDRATRIAEFMSKTLKGVGPAVAKGRDITMLKEMMDGAAARITNGDLKSVPAAELQLRSTIGETYKQLGLLSEAAAMLEPAVPFARSLYSGNHSDIAQCINQVAELTQLRGDIVASEKLFRESLTMQRLAAPGDSARTASYLNNLAQVLLQRGDLDNAEPLFREALAMDERLTDANAPEVATDVNNLAILLQSRGDLAGAEPLLRRSLAIRKQRTPGDDPEVATALNNLASLLDDRNELADAEALYREALAMRQRLLPGDHDDVAGSLNNLGYICKRRKNLTDAESFYRQSLEMRRRIFLGDDHPNIANSLVNLAGVLLELKQYTEAETLCRESVAMSSRSLGAEHWQTGNTRIRLARALIGLGRFAEAEAQYLESIRVFGVAKGVPPGMLKGLPEAMASLYEQWDKAEPGNGHAEKATHWKAKTATSTEK